MKLYLYAHDSGALVLRATLSHPEGNVFFTITDFHLKYFITGKTDLQSLFESAAAGTVTIEAAGAYKLYNRNDTGIRLSHGEKRFSQF